jgi:hypothetical protein
MMNSKIVIAAGLLLAFVLGTAASGLTGRAFNRPDDTAVVTDETPQAPAVVYRTRYVEPRPSVVAANPAPVSRDVEATVEPKKKRSWQKEALIIGGSAGAGAAIGAVAGGKKGAAVGAISGGVAGLIYDMATRNK